MLNWDLERFRAFRERNAVAKVESGLLKWVVNTHSNELQATLGMLRRSFLGKTFVINMPMANTDEKAVALVKEQYFGIYERTDRQPGFV